MFHRTEQGSYKKETLFFRSCYNGMRMIIPTLVSSFRDWHACWNSIGD